MAYKEQYDRMRRWYEKFSSLTSGRLHDIPSENYIDDVYAFFLNAYHLKDWIKNDNGIPKNVQDLVENYINGKAHLSLCADICNSLKHLKLDGRGSRSGENPAFGRKQYGLALGAAPTTIALKYEVVLDSGATIDAFEIATGCVKAWDEFFQAHKL